MAPRREKNWNVYDGVSGRIRKDVLDTTMARDYAGVRPSMAPDELLLKFQRIDEVPFEEQPDLPSSEVLNALHYYASQAMRKYGEPALRMYDDTALVAMGVIVEEIIKDALGPNGHLVWAQDKGGDFAKKHYANDDDFEEDIEEESYEAYMARQPQE